MANETEKSKALSVLKETVVKRPRVDGSQQVSPTGVRLMRMMNTIGWGGTRPLSVEEIIQLSAVLICLDVLSQDIAKVDFHMYRRLKGGGSEKVEFNEHPLALLFASRPNRFMTWHEFWIMMLLHIGITQNGFVAKRIEGNVVKELIPAMPARTTVLAVDPEHDSSGWGFYAYKVDRYSQHERIQFAKLPEVFLPQEFIHFRGRMFDGLFGYSNLEAGAKSFGMANELQNYSTRLYLNDGGMRGVFQTGSEPGENLSDVAFERLRGQLGELLTNMRRHNVPIVLEEGMTFQSISMNADQAEASKSKDAAILDIARTFRIPPHKIMHLINVKYENMETLEKSYVQDSLIPYARAIEKKLEQSLLTPREQAEFFLQFDRRAMLLNDQQQLSEVSKVLLQNGAMEIDQALGAFGFNPLPNGQGQMRLIPSTFNLVDRTNKIIIPAGAQPVDDGTKPADGSKPKPKPKPKDEDEDDTVVKFPSLVGER